MSENLFDLYSQKILELAMAIPHLEPLEVFDHEATARSPICGSQITVRLTITDNKIVNFSQDVKACALGQASAAIFGQVVIGRTLDEIENLEKQMQAFLEKSADIPDAPFNGYEVLTPAQDYKNRHASIMLPIRATLEAFQ